METSRSRGDRYALSALRNKRASLTSEIVQLERQLRHRKESLGHVDATLRLLDPSVEIDAIPNKRLPKRLKLFRQGELGRLILGVLRNADTPQSTAAITRGVLAAGGHGESADDGTKGAREPHLPGEARNGAQERQWQGRAVAACLADQPQCAERTCHDYGDGYESRHLFF